MAVAVARKELLRLLKSLKQVRSPLQRIKLLTRGWKTLRQLNGVQLRQLASDVGFDGAEELLSQLARGKGLDPHVLIKALRQTQEVAPEEFAQIKKSMRDPERRALLMTHGIDAVGDLLHPEEEIPAPPTVEPEPEPTPQARPSPPVGSTAVPLSKDPKPLSRPEPVAPPRPAPRIKPVPSPPPPLPPVSDALFRRLAAEKTLLRRLRMLHRDVEELRDADLVRLRELVETFPAGWARRRALNNLLRAQIPSDLHQATLLLESLDSPISARWCLATILDVWELTERERRALTRRHGLRPAPSELLQDRLGHL